MKFPEKSSVEITSSQIILICKTTRIFSSDQIFSISQTTEIFTMWQAKSLVLIFFFDKQNYLNFFHNVSGKTTCFFQDSDFQARLHICVRSKLAGETTYY